MCVGGHGRTTQQSVKGHSPPKRHIMSTAPMIQIHRSWALMRMPPPLSAPLSTHPFAPPPPPPPSCTQIITPWVALFFVVVIVLGAFMMLQLFLAILLASFDSVRNPAECIYTEGGDSC